MLNAGTAINILRTSSALNEHTDAPAVGRDSNSAVVQSHTPDRMLCEAKMGCFRNAIRIQK